MIYWSNGSVITSVDVDFPTNAQNVWTIGEDDEILSIHTLSPGQQPQYCEYNIVVSCEQTIHLKSLRTLVSEYMYACVVL